MAIFIGLFVLGFLVSFAVLRFKGGVILNILVFAVVAAALAVLATALFHNLYPFGHPARFQVQTYWFIGSAIAAIAGPLLGAILAARSRRKRASAAMPSTPQGDGI